MSATPIPAAIAPPRRFGALSRVALLGLVVLTGLLIPFPSIGRIGSYLSDLLHAPVFCVLSYLAIRLLDRQFGQLSLIPLLMCWICLSGFGLAAEFMQDWVGRSASRSDAIANALGAAGGIAWSRRTGRPINTVLACGLVGFAQITPLLLIGDCFFQRMQFPDIGTFESRHELSRWHPVFASVQRSKLHAQSGEWSLRYWVRPQKYSSAIMQYPPRDWRGYAQLSGHIYVAGHRPRTLQLEIHDAAHNQEYEDRFHGTLHLQPGPNRFVIPLHRIQSAPKGRQMQMDRISQLQFYVAKSEEAFTVYLDDLKLDREFD